MSDLSDLVPECARLPADFAAVAANLNVPTPSWQFGPKEETILKELVKPYGGIWVKSFYYYNGEYAPRGERMSLFFSEKEARKDDDAFYSVVKRPISMTDAIFDLNLKGGAILEMNAFPILADRLSFLLRKQCAEMQESPVARL